ncbi:Uncharacterised protein [Bordetella pertussis]|nr:Uncharacterised protein [Bordetella pertussis]
MARQQVERLVQFGQAAPAAYGVAQHGLVAVVMAPRFEQEQAVFDQLLALRGLDARRLAGLVQAHAREHARQFLHVALAVAALHAQGVQLQQFARVVLVDVAGAVADVVQVDQHGGRTGGGGQQVAELAQRMRPYGLVFVGAEVVHPEPGHLLLQLVGGIKRQPDGALHGFVGALARHHAVLARGRQLAGGIFDLADFRGPAATAPADRRSSSAAARGPVRRG